MSCLPTVDENDTAATAYRSCQAQDTTPLTNADTHLVEDDASIDRYVDQVFKSTPNEAKKVFREHVQREVNGQPTVAELERELVAAKAVIVAYQKASIESNTRTDDKTSAKGVVPHLGTISRDPLMAITVTDQSRLDNAVAKDPDPDATIDQGQA